VVRMKDRSAVAVLPPFVAEIGLACSRSVRSLINNLSTLPVRTKGLLVIGVMLAFVVHIGAVWLWSVNREHTRDRIALDHAQALHKGLQALLVQSLDADANMNAFLLTGQLEHLRAYRALEESEPQLLDQLASLVADRPEEKKWVHRAATDTEQFLDALSGFQYAASPDISEPGSLQELMATAERAAIKVRRDVGEIEKAEQQGLGRVIQEDGRIGWLGVGIATEILLALTCGWAGYGSL
jgi:CHASE3 domain sensor protein